MVDYANHPIFGTGFYTGSLALADMYGGYYTLFPALYHNTFIQILASCGSVGFLAYAVHRTQSILSFIKHPTTKRAYLGLLLICMLLINLFDVHIFCIFSTILYSALISLFFQT
jgi:O-antigen ligase